MSELWRPLTEYEIDARGGENYPLGPFDLPHFMRHPRMHGSESYEIHHWTNVRDYPGETWTEPWAREAWWERDVNNRWVELRHVCQGINPRDLVDIIKEGPRAS